MRNLCAFRTCDSCGQEPTNFCCINCEIHLCYPCNIEATAKGHKKIRDCPRCKKPLK